MTPNKPDRAQPPWKAFVKAHSYKRALAMFRAGANLAVHDGERASLPGGGHKIRFKPGGGGNPFEATRTGGGIRINRGMIFYCGRTILYPTTTFANTDAVCLRFEVDIDCIAGAPLDPWELLSAQNPDPVMEACALGTIGEHCRVVNTVGDTVTSTPGTVYVPLAFWSNGKLYQRLRTNESWVISGSGAIYSVGNQATPSQY